MSDLVLSSPKHSPVSAEFLQQTLDEWPGANRPLLLYDRWDGGAAFVRSEVGVPGAETLARSTWGIAFDEHAELRWRRDGVVYLAVRVTDGGTPARSSEHWDDERLGDLEDEHGALALWGEPERRDDGSLVWRENRIPFDLSYPLDPTLTASAQPEAVARLDVVRYRDRRGRIVYQRTCGLSLRKRVVPGAAERAT